MLCLSNPTHFLTDGGRGQLGCPLRVQSHPLVSLHLDDLLHDLQLHHRAAAQGAIPAETLLPPANTSRGNHRRLAVLLLLPFQPPAKLIFACGKIQQKA